MRWFLSLVCLLIAAAAFGNRILLVPLDSRPAAGQFAQMIGRIDGVDVRMPPFETLGRFTTPGNSDRILDWLEDQDMSDVTSIVASTDMICYGGLIASRIYDVSSVVAARRINRLLDIKRRFPRVKLYLFSSTMRLAPTATMKASKFRLRLARYEELKDMAFRNGDANARIQMLALKKKIPIGEIEQYELTRQRNHRLQRLLIQLTKDALIDFLVIGQDDAKPFGPHVPETEDLKQLVRQYSLGWKVYFCEGVDQHSTVLLSRALLKEADWTPRVRVVFSDEEGRLTFANFESQRIEQSLSEQLLASGARPVGKDGLYDYTLYLNTPGRRETQFKKFVENLKSDLDKGEPTAVADINFANDGTADPELFDALWDQDRLTRLLSYAGWNTAGNTIGTAIPAANIYLLAKRSDVDPLVREVAQREFLIHRFINDYAYHKFTRPSAYALIEPGHHDEIYGEEWDEVNTYVSRDLLKHLRVFFDQGFLGHSFVAGDRSYQFAGISDAKVWLPWPRPYEARLEFHIQVRQE
ncbi:MAG: DUF4127 family protein [Fimbriimonas sp.]|nr:DUF4127 family protein [Fimbriimonas sp.]